MVEFKLPAIAPITEEEEEAFAELEDVLASESVSSTIGWVVRVGKDLEEKRKEISLFSSKLKGTFSGRCSKNWGILLFFLDKVCFINGLLFLTRIY